MRISDWSSDVCSSDLKGVTVNEAEAYPGYTLYSSGHGTEAFLIALDGTVVQKWALPFSAIYDPELSSIENPRSEAYTSELQSLMRISYAVFCLKTTT